MWRGSLGGRPFGVLNWHCTAEITEKIVGSAQRTLRDCGAQRHVKETREREGSGMAKPLSLSRLFYIFLNRRSGATGLVWRPLDVGLPVKPAST